MSPGAANACGMDESRQGRLPGVRRGGLRPYETGYNWKRGAKNLRRARCIVPLQGDCGGRRHLANGYITPSMCAGHVPRRTAPLRRGTNVTVAW